MPAGSTSVREQVPTMHEAYIAQCLIEEVGKCLVPGQRPQTVKVQLGRFSGVVPHALEFAFQALVPETRLAGTELEIIEVPLVVRCPICGRNGEQDLPVLLCEACGASQVEVISGRELLLESIVVEEQ